MITIIWSFYKPYTKRKTDEDDEDIEYGAIWNSNFVSHLVSLKKRKPRRAPKRVRNKEWWENCYRRWSGKDFKKDLRVTRATFSLILDVIAPCIFKEPTNLIPEPISVDRQLGLTLYRLGHGASYSTLSQLFGVSILLASERFVEYWLWHLMINTLRCPRRMKSEWESEVKGFIENYEFPCVGAWDGFYVYVSNKLKSFYSFKKRYSISNLGLIECNKKFLYCGVGVPGSIYDSRMLCSTSLYKEIISGNCTRQRNYIRRLWEHTLG